MSEKYGMEKTNGQLSEKDSKTYGLRDEVVEAESFEALASGELLYFVMRKMGYQNMEHEEIPSSVSFIASKVTNLSVDDAVNILRKAVLEYRDDPNIPADEYEIIMRFEDSSYYPSGEVDQLEVRMIAALIRYHSPYTEVRSMVSPTDDPSIPIETFRAYFIATFWSVVGSGFNEFFRHRQVPISIETAAVQLLICPIGKLWANKVPLWGFTVRGRRFAINVPEPWSEKEQMFATLLYSITLGSFYSSFNILTMKKYYNDDVSYLFQLLLSISLQFMGFGFAGVLRRFVVYPAKAVWPSCLPSIAVNKALLSRKDKSGGLSIQNFFYISLGVLFAYNWIPTVLAGFLANFNWMTWLAPNNFNLAAITGGSTGLAYNPLPSFDLNAIAYFTPLVTPFFAYSHIYIGAVIASLVVIALYYSNYMESQYLPVFSQSLYTNKATKYNISEILVDYKVDEAKYQTYSPPYYSAGVLVSYGSFLCFYTMVFGFAIIDEFRVLYEAFRDWFFALLSLRHKKSWIDMWASDYHVLSEFDDAHSRLMRNYKEVPDWWFFVVLVVAIAFAIIVIECFNSQTPLWLLFLSIGLNFIFLIPLTTLHARTTFTAGLNLLVEMIVGYILPGNPYALMLIKAFGYNIDGQADNYISNMKVAHYCKISPVALFRGQLVMVFIQIFVNLFVVNWQFSNISGFCDEHQPAKFSCPDIRTYYNASVMWGAMGPQKIFTKVYPQLKWCWAIGAVIGVGCALWKKYGKFYPRSFNPILIIIGMLSFSPPYNMVYFTPGFIVNFISQFYMKRYRLRIWEKYNYVLEGALKCGLVFSSLVIFAAIQYNDYQLNWWGNSVPETSVYERTYISKLNVSLTEKGYFGPDPGNFP
ncbi:Opt2p Ecym_2739 [Eremothecium cymbalariae DBVPG|uniref:OPT family small oligopeptide transporter n=1 Tax=Eremothecium cymbalariae (strain CBS 270.75 / DBVPG 7215 / KCTC 17166 / NRRL Y-17582) TaxID=931890 RepID=G8JPH2_ERECY|nr:Hypothetical protein Ecym_2739 [Eremothecium cymbalariae DBVPG\